MRSALLALSTVVAIAVAAPAMAGDVVVIENVAGKKPIALKKDSFKLGNVPDIGGKPNKGFSYAVPYELPGWGAQAARGRVEPKGTIAVHEGAGQYILYVISGKGQLTLNDKSGATISEVAYKPGDIIVFQPNTLHGWVNGNEPFEFFGVDFPAPRK